MSRILRALRFPGVRPDSFGSYLTGLGLLSATSSCWPDMRGCWRDGQFLLLHTDCAQDDVKAFFLDSWQPAEYPVRGEKRLWTEAQQKDTKKKTGEAVALERSTCALPDLVFFDSHVVSLGRNVFNPVFGTGGNIARRDLMTVARKARALLDKHPDRRHMWLEHTLFGTLTELEPLEATGTWFVWANKMYNSGRLLSQEGRLSPWSFLLALEGALLLKGSVGRRMGATSRPYAVFPFVAQAASPLNEEESRVRRARKGEPPGEFWAPVWGIPSSLTEVVAFLQRGRARVGNRDAMAPHEFGLAALGAGTDAGVIEFMPFELRSTTSNDTFEAVPRRPVHVGRSKAALSATELLAPLVSWVRRLPQEGRGPFTGLRGPVEQATRRVSEESENHEAWQDLLQVLAVTQHRVDRNQDWRTRCPALPRLSASWLDRLWPGLLPAEVQVALAVASVGVGTRSPLLTNVFGVGLGKNGQPFFPTARPQRAIWHEGDFVSLLGETLRRRLIDADPESVWPLDGTRMISSDVLSDFLHGTLDDEEIARWIPPLALLRWNGHRRTRSHSAVVRSPDGLVMLDGLFRPLVVSGLPWGNGQFAVPSAPLGLRLVHLLRHGDVGLAIDLAVSRYRTLGLTPLVPGAAVKADGERLAAGLLMPLARAQVLARRRRWVLEGESAE